MTREEGQLVLRVLREVETAALDRYGDNLACPICGEYRDEHAPWCQLKKAIAIMEAYYADR